MWPVGGLQTTGIYPAKTHTDTRGRRCQVLHGKAQLKARTIILESLIMLVLATTIRNLWAVKWWVCWRGQWGMGESVRWCLVIWRMRMFEWAKTATWAHSSAITLEELKIKRGVPLHHGGQVPVVTFWWWPYGIGRMVQTRPWNHTQVSSGSDSTLHPHCCHREVVMSLRDVPHWVLDLIPQVLNVLPLFLRQTLPTHVDVLHLQLLLIKQPLHNKHRRYTGKNDTCDPVFQYR